MLIWLAELSDHIHFFTTHFRFLNLFRYITFRTGGALFTSAFIVFLFGPRIISSLRVRQGKGQPIRADGPQTHFKKAGTPTMGGLMILAGIVVSSLLWADLANVYVVATLLVTLGFGAIGFYDDYLKVTKQSDKGFSGRARLGIEFVIAGIAVYFMMTTALSSGPAGSTFGSSVAFDCVTRLTALRRLCVDTASCKGCGVAIAQCPRNNWAFGSRPWGRFQTCRAQTLT